MSLNISIKEFINFINLSEKRSLLHPLEKFVE